jgi:hypothetical protein
MSRVVNRVGFVLIAVFASLSMSGCSVMPEMMTTEELRRQEAELPRPILMETTCTVRTVEARY